MKSEKKNNEDTLKYGLLNNSKFNHFLIESKLLILDKIPITSIEAREKIIKEIDELKRTVCK